MTIIYRFDFSIVCSVKKYEHITPTLKNLHWLPVKTHLYYRDAILLFKFMTDYTPKYLTSWFITTSQISGRVTRNSQSLNIPFFRTVTGQKTFYYRIVSIWNNINSSFKLCQNSVSFKRALKNDLLLRLSITCGMRNLSNHQELRFPGRQSTKRKS